jgi:O-antigen/teichoic acid export membrane protein
MKQTTNKTIAKNTIFLYFRMMFTLIIALYTSRVVLRVLGVEDYGLYAVVGGVVGMLAFLTNALSTGSSRFLTFELGKNNPDHLHRTFNTIYNIHILLSVVIVLLAETVGLWFVHNKLEISPERLNAAVFAYHFSIITCVIAILQVPYNASIISHEKMNVFAYISIFEGFAKLGIVYILVLGEFDKLKLYAILLCNVQVFVTLFYFWYCVRHYPETHYKATFDKSIFREISAFSGWSLFAGGSIALSVQGIAIITNIFFGSAVVVARVISLQIHSLMTTFVDNFRIAVKPQIVKKYAEGDLSGSENLVITSTKYTYYLMLFVALPIIFQADFILHLWLTNVPEYAVVFSQLIVVQCLFSVFDTGLYMSFYAKGQLRENALISPTVGFICFPIIYLLFKFGYSPVSLSWIFLIDYAILGLIIKPYLSVKIAGYSVKSIIRMFSSCFIVTIAAIPLPIILFYTLNLDNKVVKFLVICSASVLCVFVSVWLLGIDKNMRIRIIAVMKNRIAKVQVHK